MTVIRLNRQKSIGRCLFVVEGGRNEFSLLRRIFCDVLKYEYLQKRRDKLDWFQSPNRSTSKVAVVNPRESHVSFIRDQDYLDRVFQSLIEEHHFPVDQSAIYYLFDRDPMSNVQKELLEDLLGELQDPYENAGGLRGGLLLLNYPSIESYGVSCFIPDSHSLSFCLGTDVKAFVGSNRQIQLNKISEDSLMVAARAMLAYYQEHDLEFDVDGYGWLNEKTFAKQEACFAATAEYRLLSLLSVAFLQLGILEIVEAD